MSISVENNNIRYSLNNECIASSLTQTHDILSSLLVPSLKLVKDEFGGSNKNISEISTNVSNISSDLYEKDDGHGHKGLSGKVDYLISLGRDSMEYKGELSVRDIRDTSLTGFLNINLKSQDYFFKKGFLYYIKYTQNELSDSTGKLCKFYAKDYILFNSDVILSNTQVSNINIIRDAEQECLQLSADLSTLRDKVNGLNCEYSLCSENSTSVITGITQTEGQINVIAKQLVSSDVYGLSDYVISKINELCGSVSSDYFILTADNIVSGRNKYYDIQEFENISASLISSYEIHVPFIKLFDIGVQTLSNLISIDNCFESLYQGVSETVSYLDVYKGIKIDFDVSYPILSTFYTINIIGRSLDVEIEELGISSTVNDGFVQMRKILDENGLSITRDLDSELKQINLRFDNMERAVASHTQQLSSLSSEYFETKEDLYDKVNQNTESISKVSSDFYTLSSTTFKKSTNSDVQSQYLIMTEEDTENHDKYHIEFRDETLVLIKD